MHRIARLRTGHHSLTCFSQTTASRGIASLALSHQDTLVQSRLQSISRLSTSSQSSIHSRRTFTDTTMNAANGSARAKRKQPPASADERPQKQPRGSNGAGSAGDNTPEVAPMYEEEESDMEIERILPGLADTAEWQACIEKVVRNVVSIRFCQTCSFDTDAALTSEATGFVVDAERG